jgi:hypothetical protein
MSWLKEIVNWFKEHRLKKLEYDLDIEAEKKKRLLNITPEINELFTNFCNLIKDIKCSYTNDEPQIWLDVIDVKKKLTEWMMKNELLIDKDVFNKITNFVDEYFSLASKFVLSIRQRNIYSADEQIKMIYDINNKYNGKIDEIKNDLRKLIK